MFNLSGKKPDSRVMKELNEFVKNGGALAETSKLVITTARLAGILPMDLAKGLLSRDGTKANMEYLLNMEKAVLDFQHAELKKESKMEDFLKNL